MASHTLGQGARLYDGFRPQERRILVLEAMARGDEAEAERLRHACPRKTYTGPDAAFDDRLHLAFDIVAVVAVDLRALTSQLRVLHWAIDTVKHFLTMHHITTDMALMEGVRCGQGLSQSPYFALELSPWADEASDADAARKERAEPQKRVAEDQQPDLSVLGEGFIARMEAVEKRSQRSTELILKVLHRTGLDIGAELVSIWQALGDFSRSRLSLEPLQLITACAYPSKPDLEDALKVYAEIKPDPESVQKYCQALSDVWDRRFGTQPD